MKPNSERVSVIIPTYNRASYIRDAIESVLVQTYPVFEIIVVDDGSTDNTREIVCQYGDPVIYICQKNGGPGSARNKGLQNARGDFIAFLDSDDIWTPQKVEIQIDFFRKNPHVDLVFGHMANFSDTNTNNVEPEILNQEVYNYFRNNSYDPKYALDYLIIEDIIPTPSVMLKSNCLNKVGFFNENLLCAEDYDYWLRFAYNNNLGFIDQVLVRRRLHGKNIIDNYLLRERSRLAVLESLGCKNPHLSKMTKSTIAKSMRKICYNLGSYYFKLRDFDNAFRFLKQAFPYYLLNWKFAIKIAWSFLFHKNRCS